MRWRPCCLCSRHWPVARTCWPCTPDRSASCGWRLPMRDDVTYLDRRNVAVVIPALNEALRIRGVVEGALAHCDHVIVIDDGSEDDTVARIADLPVILLRHPRRRGKGASLRDGFAAA